MKPVCMFFCTLQAFVLGYAFVRYLTCHPTNISIYLFLTCTSGFTILLLLYECSVKRHILPVALILTLFFFVSGYLGTLHLFMNISEKRELPQILREKGDTGLGHTAVVVLAHGEPETYDPIAWIKQIKELDQQKIAFVPYPIRPFFFNSLREKYLTAGKSGHNAECFEIMKQIEAEYRSKGDSNTKFYISYLENEPHPDTAVVQALNDGASRITLCNIFVTISNHTQEAIDMIKPLHLEDYGVEIKYTKPLYDSEALQMLYTDKVNSSASGLDKEKVGVILVGHGQPEEWDKEFPTETRQENSFRTDILKSLELQGYNPANLKLAWMEFREPKPGIAVKHMVENGVTEIFYFSTIIGSESLHAKFDVPKLMNSVKIPDTIKLHQLTAFEDKVGIVRALIERIQNCR